MIQFRRNKRFRYRLVDSFTGPFALMVDAEGTIRTAWAAHLASNWSEYGSRDEALEPELIESLQRYFAGDPVSFADAPLPGGGGSFHRACWKACREIPAGETISYGELARRAGSTRAAARAAGQAMRRNPLPIITPCHRVIGSTGALHGFAGSTEATSDPVALKRALLEHERAGVHTAGILAPAC